MQSCEETRELEGGEEADAPGFEAGGELEESCEAEEAATAAAEQTNDAFKLYLRDIHRTKLLTREEEKELALKVARGDRAARDRMITANLRLVVKIAKRYLNRGLPYLDLIEEGNLGLIKAVERFQVSRGFRFSTLATWWIRQAVERALMNQSRSVRLPVHVNEEIGRLSREAYHFRKALNREPTVAELAQAMGVELNRVRKLKVLMMQACSLDQPIGENSSFTLAATLVDTAAPSPVDQIAGNCAYERVAGLIKTFSEAEKNILTLRFGLDDHEPQTLETIGRSFGLTRERIRQIEAASLMKLRKLLGPHDDLMASC